jgi:hypothetical protein
MKGMKPQDRLLTLEKLSSGLWDIIKQMEVDNMNLKGRVDELERQLKSKAIPYGMTYDALREIELNTSPCGLDETSEQWEARFIAEYGTREEFITERTKIREV